MIETAVAFVAGVVTGAAGLVGLVYGLAAYQRRGFGFGRLSRRRRNRRWW